MGRRTFHHLVLIIALTLATTGSAAEHWRFAMTCDSRGSYITGVNEQVLSELVGEIGRDGVDFVLFPGDLVYGARLPPADFEDQLWTWVRIMGPLYEAGIGVYPSRGNHEVGDAWDIDWGILPDPLDNYSLRWLHVFGNEQHPELKLPDNGPPNARFMSYTISHKNALILTVDQYGGTKHRLAHAVDQSWVDSQLWANRKPHVFVCGHEPAFRMLHPDCLDYHPAQRDAFWTSLKAGGARAYFCGHDHFYDHAWVDDGDGDPNNDIHQFDAATAGAPWYSWTPPYGGNNSDFRVSQIYHAESYGYILVDVNDLDVTMTWMERQGNDLLQPPVYRPADVWRYRASLDPVVLQPNGGERLYAGRPYPIRWRTVDEAQIDRVVIEYSLDAGASWTVAEEVDNTGTYTWTVPAVNLAAGLVRVRDARTPSRSDTSDRVFVVVTCPAHLAADLNGDCRVDFADLALFAREWLACADPLDPACAGRTAPPK